MRYTNITDSILQIASQNEAIAAALVAFVGSYLLYGILGKQMLGADDDYWEAIRAQVLPRLDKIAQGSGFYAENQSSEDEYAAIVSTDIEDLEVILEDNGMHRNPLSGLKTSPHGVSESGSWAYRNGNFGNIASAFKKAFPFDGLFIGRFLNALSDVFAVYQLHIALYEYDGGDVWVYAHYEYNSLNPFVAIQHYRGKGMDIEKGVSMARELLINSDAEIQLARIAVSDNGEMTSRPTSNES